METKIKDILEDYNADVTDIAQGPTRTFTIPKPIGSYTFSRGLVYNVYNKKPRWLTRFLLNKLLEIKWEDA